jgi:hypothetical protein
MEVVQIAKEMHHFVGGCANCKRNASFCGRLFQIEEQGSRRIIK